MLRATFDLTTDTPLVVEVELSPLARQASTTYVHDVQVEGDRTLEVGQRIQLRDEVGQLWDAQVTAIEATRLGNKFRLHIGPATDAAPRRDPRGAPPR
ncbi:hypothetical protein [Nocardioides zeicaulis]|uniref:hypothetical protein n=1 Tax=Nocardioides zeicaulis TaxID=1776857 RepID=UPI0039EF634C